MTSRDWRAEYEQRPLVNVDGRLATALACPFCAGRDLELGRMLNYVHCRRCGADGPDVGIARPRDTQAAWERAVAAWNLRPTR